MGFDYAGKVRGLLANAEDESLSDEARQSYRDAAFRIMRDYAIAQEDAIAVDPTVAVPTSLSFTLRAAGVGQGDLSYHYQVMMETIARHTGVRVMITRDSDWNVIGTLVGYDLDLRYTEFLWTGAYLMFSTKIDPTWDKNRSEDENIFLLRSSGLPRGRVADMAWGNGNEASARSKVQRIYVREATRRGEPVRAAGLGFDSSAYRSAYADTFITTLARRLRIARDASDSVRGGLVLHGRAERVNEAFYDMFPRERPVALRDDESVSAWIDPRTGCPKCAKAKSGACNEHSYLRERAWTAADQARVERRENSSSRRAGQHAGAAAAEGVEVQRGTARAGRLDRSGNAIEG